VIDASAVAELERCIAGGGLAVFPTDTLYGIGCAPDDEEARERLYELKGRPRTKPSAVMFFSMEAASPVLERLEPRTRAALEALLPGPVLFVLPGNEGIRIPRVEGALASTRTSVLQTSANLTGGPDPRRLEDVPESLRAGADLVLDGGELPGVPSTVVDLSRYESEGRWELLREGAVPADTVSSALRS
jgi:L-threonylcarbamoyladenylate synthase